MIQFIYTLNLHYYSHFFFRTFINYFLFFYLFFTFAKEAIFSWVIETQKESYRFIFFILLLFLLSYYFFLANCRLREADIYRNDLFLLLFYFMFLRAEGFIFFRNKCYFLNWFRILAPFGFLIHIYMISLHSLFTFYLFSCLSFESQASSKYL